MRLVKIGSIPVRATQAGVVGESRSEYFLGPNKTDLYINPSGDPDRGTMVK